MAIDWGSTKLAMIMARQTREGMNIEAVQSIPYSDVQGDDWRDIDFVASLLCQSITEFKNTTVDGAVRTILGIPGYYTGILENSCSIEIDGGIVTQSHISSILEDCSKYPLPSEWGVLQAIPRRYTIDGINQVDNPIDMRGSSLEVDSCLVCVNQKILSQITDRLAERDIHIDYVRPSLLSSANIFLTDMERQMGGILIDIGGKSTDIIIYRDGVPVFTEWFPVGGSSVTNDLSIGLDISHEQAEELKRQCVLGLDPSENSEGEQLHMPLKIGNSIKDIPLDYIQKIAELRIEELFELIEESIDNSNTVDRKDCNVVIIGGGLAPIRGARGFANSHLGCGDVRLGKVDLTGIPNATTVASAYALIMEQALALPSDDMEEEQLSFIDKIKQWLLAFFNK